jgi:site-specific recombinase XerD
MPKIPGIFERPKKSGVWWISYCDTEGMRHREKIGRRALALDKVSQRRSEIREGRYIPPTKGARITFRELAQAAMTQKKLRLALSSYKTDTMRLAQLLPLIGHVPADRLTPDRVEEALARLITSRNLTGSTVNRYRSLISSIYAFALRSGRIAVNPVSRVKRYRENDSRIRWLKPTEEAAIRVAIDHLAHESEFDLALHTGMRRGEQFLLKWKDCDLERGILTVKGKTGRRHIVANRSALKALRTLKSLQPEDAVFVSPDATENATRDWRRWLEAAVKKAKVDDFHWHDLRHTFASRLVMRGVDIRTVQELLGHKSIVMTMKYAHLARDHRQAAAEKMNDKEARPMDGKKDDKGGKDKGGKDGGK